MYFLTINPSKSTRYRWSKRIPPVAIRWNRVLDILEGGGSFTTREIAKLLKIKVRSCYRFLAWASSLIPLVEERRGTTNYYWVEKPIKKQGEKI